jgi:hypothetical protein
LWYDAARNANPRRQAHADPGSDVDHEPERYMMPYLLAMRRPLNLLVLLAALLAGLTVGLWLLPLGLLAYAAAVALAARDPELMREAARLRSRRLSSPTFRALEEELGRSQREVEHSIRQTSGPLARILQPVLTQTEELLQQAHDLAQKGQIIERYLAANNPDQLQNEINNLDDRLARTGDSYTIQQLQQTRAALVDRQSNAQVLETYIGRIVAQLQNIDANLDNVLAETVRLRTADAASADSAGNQVAQRLSDLNADMNAFQQVLENDMRSALGGASS